MQGAQRVVFFCGMVAVLPVLLLLIPLYLRNNVFADVHYPVAESDILEMPNGISSVFCQEHSLRMNTPFHAFHAKGKPEISKTVQKHIRLKKSMSLPDDTLEYWGFFLPASSTVLLSVCSRYDGSRILVVKGEKNLRNCGLLQPTKASGHLAEGEGNIQVKHESAILMNADNTPNWSLPTDDAREQIDEAGYIEENKGIELNQTNKSKISFEERRNNLDKILNSDDSETGHREKRQVPAYKLDGGIAHGGNALNYTEKVNDSSVSSFENSLLTCYDGQILLSESFLPSKQCNGTQYLEIGKHLRTIHNVSSDGYYYYIFYSDNDYVQNDIYAIFDIHKPTYEFGNYSSGCINQTTCRFPVSFWSMDNVVVEVPTRDGIENEHDDITILTSTCHPRTAVYAIFPVSILLLILVCSFA